MAMRRPYVTARGLAQPLPLPPQPQFRIAPYAAFDDRGTHDCGPHDCGPHDSGKPYAR